MFMKIFKFFVCLFLILSISLVNSFAAISVSDGSAFVTKAEFAADLNNLSNRMSTLENSLDAKIDSLVSSYLSRNGIWNGEKQVVNTVPTEQVGLKWEDKGGSNNVGWVLNQIYSNTLSGSATSATSTIAAANNNIYLSASFKYIPKSTSTMDTTIVSATSKSGLANLIVNFSDATYDFETYLDYVGGIVHGDFWGSTFTQEYSVTSGSDLVYYDVFNFNMPTHASYKLNYKTVINCYFFVSKGSNIKLKITPNVRSGSMPVKGSAATNMGCKVSSWSVSIY